MKKVKLFFSLCVEETVLILPQDFLRGKLNFAFTLLFCACLGVGVHFWVSGLLIVRLVFFQVISCSFRSALSWMGASVYISVFQMDFISSGDANFGLPVLRGT